MDAWINKWNTALFKYSVHEDKKEMGKEKKFNRALWNIRLMSSCF